MRSIEEPNKYSPKQPYYVLVTEQGEALKPAWVEYWKRILTDGYGLAPASRFELTQTILVGFGHSAEFSVRQVSTERSACGEAHSGTGLDK
jgi:hypothetical protein